MGASLKKSLGQNDPKDIGRAIDNNTPGAPRRCCRRPLVQCNAHAALQPCSTGATLSCIPRVCWRPKLAQGYKYFAVCEGQMKVNWVFLNGNPCRVRSPFQSNGGHNVVYSPSHGLRCVQTCRT